MTVWAFRIAQRVSLLVALSLLGALLGATLVRFAPGYGMDESELDPRLSQASREAIRREHRVNSSLLSYYGAYLASAARGDFGSSAWLHQPISGLLRERFPVTLRSVVLGVISAWAAASLLALAALFYRGWLLDLAGTLASGFLIALPVAVVAIFAVYLRVPVFVAIGAVIFPKVYSYLRNLLLQANDQPHVLAARARGVSRTRLLLWHVIPLAAGPVAALFGVSISMAFGAAIPIEALCDAPGLGQLAWLAALNRDLPLIMTLTLAVTLVTVAANSAAELLHERA
ncbi:MAG TPA: ABC transporter permease [Candidatus Binatia bacterium]|nr:ABC transporter permease [Candidatus Binatia bacterium]